MMKSLKLMCYTVCFVNVITKERGWEGVGVGVGHDKGFKIGLM